MKKKVVWLPYDMDTAIGINNEGALVFSYNLEDTDQVDGSDVYNGQQSVLWNNLRKTYAKELRDMYVALRDDKENRFSYEFVEKRFEEHQKKWPEAIFNEDAWFKYLQPYIENGEKYLSMLQGSKEEQRKWWLYNRFRYMDSKYNTGDAKNDAIKLRGYAKATISIVPYADIYGAILFGSIVVQKRAERNKSYDFPCPLDNVNDTETAIYSASQIASIGDLAPYMVGQCDISKAIKLQELKVGDADPNYSNSKLLEVTFGNNTLLKKVDFRNCVSLGTTDPTKVSTPAPDLSGCTGLEEAYFEGTQITGIQFPNGGVLRVAHLPATVVSLQIFNQPKITDLSIPSYSQLRNVALVNTGDLIDEVQMIKQLTNGTYVRFVGFNWSLANVAELQTLKAKLDLLGGLDETGNYTMDMAQLQGNIYIPTLTGAAVAEFQASYPSVTFTYDHITAELKYYSWDGQTLLHTETITDGGNGTYTGTPSREQTAQYTFAFSGWSTEQDASAADANALKNVEADRNVYAAYTKTVRTYTVRFMNGSTVLQTVNNVPYGGSATYTGATPVHSDPDNYEFKEWDPSPNNITGPTDCQVVWKFIGSVALEFVRRSFVTSEFNLPAVTKVGQYAFQSNKAVRRVAFENASVVENTAFGACNMLEHVSLPNVTTVSAYAFEDCISLSSIELPKMTSYGTLPFSRCTNLTSVSLPALIRANGSLTGGTAISYIELPAVTYTYNTFSKTDTLTAASLPALRTLSYGTFNDCSALSRIFILSPSCAELKATASTVFRHSPILDSSYLGYFGSIYVPASLVDAYKSATNWAAIADRITAYTGE